MKKSRLALIFAIILLCVSLSFTLNSCGDDEHIHTPNNAVRENEIAATCESAGSYDEVIYCSDCDEEISRTTKIIEKLSHTSSDWITDTEATCKSEGEKHKECTVCHTELETGKIDKLTTHIPADAVIENEVDAKCNAFGSCDEVIYCSVCDTELSREEKEISKLPHTEVIDAAKEPTCTETGLTEGKHCLVCSTVLVAQETVKANGHTDDNSDYTCDICTDDLCTEHVEEIIPAISATCTKTGLTEGKKCSICGDILVVQETVRANGHNYIVKNTDSTYFATAADCENAATYFYSCACGDKGTTTFTHGEPNGHSYIVENTDSKYFATSADCDNAATYFYSCTCGDKGTTTFAHGEPNGHSYIIENTDSKYFATAADCENAATYFHSCTCGDKGTTTFAHGEPNGHNFIVEKVDIKYQHTPATEYSAAIYYKSCSCGKASSTNTFVHGDMLEGYLTYKLSQDSSYYIVTGYVGAQTEISVPHLHDGLPVFVIKDEAFRDNTYIKSISMPNSIQVIGSYAFANCTALESIIIPTSVTDISPYTFSGCTALETITLHSEIDTLGAFAFEKCSALKSITLNEGLKTISDNVFDYCTALERILIPDTVTTLGNMAFRHAESLETVKFSKALKSIGNATFQYCVKLDSVELHENINTLGNSTFSYCDELKSIRILGNLTTIGTATFYECRSLETIYYASNTPSNCGDSNYIFYNAGINGEGITLTIAKDAVIPDGFFTPYVEENMPKITKIVIEDGSTNVSYALKYNKLPYLTEIFYPSTVTDPCYGAFNNSLWWDNQDFGEVFINGIFYGYKCHCYMATPEEPVTENYHDSTCTEDGSYDTVIYCEVCSDELSRETITVAKKGHTECEAVTENFVDSDCENDGSYDTVIYCEVCGDELSRETITVAKKGHDYINYEAKSATCTEIGWDAYQTCSRCDYTSYEEIETLGHDYVNHSAKDATCTEIGWYEYDTCSRCSHSTYEEISKLGHDYIHHDAKAKTCTSIGWKTYDTCSRCDYTTYIEIPASHNPKSAVEENRIESKCNEEGSYQSVVYCYDCNEELNRANKEIKRSHKMSGDSCTVCGLPQSSSGLEFALNSDGKGYTLIGIGSCTSKSIVIGVYNNLSVTEIGSSALANCTSLTSVTIPDIVTTIGNYAFNKCTSLMNITVDKDNPNYMDIDGNLYNKDGKTLILYAIGKENSSFTIPDSVTSIGNSAFSGCTNLASVTIPDSVASIGSSAFSGCTNLASITLPFVGETKDGTSNTHFGYIFGAYDHYYNSRSVPSSLKSVTITCDTSINDYAFYNCTSLTSIKIPSIVTSIGVYGFYNCTSLTHIEIPSNVISIDLGAFLGCTALEEIYFNATAMNDLGSDNSVFTNAGKNGDGIKVVIGKNVTKLPAYLFYPRSDTSSYSPKITSVEFEEGSVCESIGKYTFYGCTTLEQIYFNAIAMNDLSSDSYVFTSAGKNGDGIKVVIGKDVAKLPAYLFYSSSDTSSYSPKITSVEFEEGSVCESIGSWAFGYCSSLKSIEIPSSITSIGSSAFYGSIITSVYITDITVWCNIEFDDAFANPLSHTHNLYLNGDLITDLVIPESVTNISSYAFYNCTSLESVNISKHVTSIGRSVFDNCTALEKIYFNATAMNDLSDNNHVFYNAGKNGDGIKVVIGKSVTKLPTYLFYPSSQTWSYSPKITSVEFEEESVCESIGQYAFAVCTSLTSVTIGDAVTSIGPCAFYKCTSITSVTIPNSVTSIGGWTFDDCTSLESVNIGNNVTSIGSYAFSGCKSLTSVTIPDSVTSIDRYAFFYCSSLTSIIFEDTSTWYRTTSSSDWGNMTGGTSTSVTNSSTNATYFKSTYYDYYWYKI